MNRRPNHPPEQKGRPKRRRRPGNQGGENRQRPEAEVVKKGPPELKKYSVVFYENHAQAREDIPKLAELRNDCDQLNIVIKSEGTMDDPELTVHGRVYAGEAWHLIHRRRVDDGWYNEKRE